MARRPMTICSSPGCSQIVTSGKCPRHAAQHQQREAARKREYEVSGRRPKRSLPTWDPAWRSLRAGFLRQHPRCSCGQPATQVHHIVPVSVNPDLRLDWKNCLALCAPCHARIEATTPGHWTRRVP